MVKRCFIFIFLFLSLLLPNVSSAGELVINEVMSNEPGGSTSLEWIEIYNSDSSSNHLNFYLINIDGQLLDLSQSFILVPPFEYVVLCRDSISYESVWGNNGETNTIYEVPGIQLVNGSGEITLLKFSTDTVSQFNWSSAGADGVSWERLFPDSMQIKNSVDPSGSTPGRINSVTPRNNDLGLASVAVWPRASKESGLEIIVVNNGLQFVGENVLSIYYDNDGDSLVQSSDLIATLDLFDTFPGDTIRLVVYLELDGVYPKLLIKLPDDDQPLNNLELITAFGVDYPPVIVSEFLPDPQAGARVEWVEIKNRSNLDIDLDNWFLGDSLAFYQITDSQYIFRPGEYLVLCKDSAGFTDTYGTDSIGMIRLSSWPALNNKSDIVRLKDHFGFVADSFHYSYVFGDNHSWSRGEEIGLTDRWGRSVADGGSPGLANEVYLEPASERIKLTVTPNPFSPRLDGEMEFNFEMPPGDNITLKIYDLQGRIVKTLADNLPPYDGRIIWFGDSDAGRSLPVGMYILYVEVSGIDSYKQTIVIAP